MATVIAFPVPTPSFAQWLTERVGGRWIVTKRRTATWRGLDMTDRVQLLPREYAEYERQYVAIYGDRWAA